MKRVKIVKHFLRTSPLGNLITFLQKVLNFPKFARLLIHLCIISGWGCWPPSEPSCSYLLRKSQKVHYEQWNPLLIPTSLVNGGKRGGTAGPHFPRKRHGLFNAGHVPCASTSERECSHLSCTEMSSSRLTSSCPITPIANPTTQPPDQPLSLEMAHTHNEYIRREALP